MNAEIIFTEFAKFAESDDKYYTFGKHGVIEDMLAFMGLPSKSFRGASSAVHSDNLEILHDYLIHHASNEQLMYVSNVVKGGTSIPAPSPLTDSNGKVFVSMPMNKDKCSYVDEIRTGIERALKNTGNTPYFLDKDAHNDNIYKKMLEEITACKFLVADLSTQNTGVYYEAGYAKALGKTVILTCQSDDFKNRHFDVQQVQTLRWADANELANVLGKQIQDSNLSER